MMKRTIARLLVFVLLCSTLISVSPLVASAAPTTQEYNSLLALHRNNPNWSYQEYCARINSIAELTDEEDKNWDEIYLNPWIYEKYGSLIVYGSPHGDFYVTSEGKMKKVSTGQIGEYQYLGYNYDGASVTNDRYFNINASGGGFKVPGDYVTTNWLKLDTNMQGSWGRLYTDQINYLKTSGFFDDDYTGSPTNRPATTLATFLGGKTIEDYAYVQVAPKVMVGGSVQLRFRKANGNLSWNTLVYDPLYPNLALVGNLNTDSNTYRIPAGTNEVSVNATVTGTVSNCPTNLLDKMTFDYYGQSTSKTIGTLATQSAAFTKKYTRSNLKVGSNTVELTANISVSTKLNDPPKTITVKKTVTIIVEENINPYATCILTASPNNIIYKGANMPVDLTIDYGIVGITDLTKISNVQVTVFNESGTFAILSPAVSGSKTFNVTIPASFMSGATTKNKIYEAQVTYNLTDYTKLSARASASVHIGPDPVPPPPPQPENNPPVCTLYAPQTVRAGQEFGASLNAYDPDGDSLICDIISYPANTVFTTSDYKYKTLWYDKQYVGTTQSLIGTATDGKDGAGDSKYVAVTAPTVDARINVSGTLKANRRVSISDGSDTPKYYPIASRSWSITPVTAGLSSTDIKYNGSLSGVQSKDLIFKKPGQYKITLTVTNTAGYSASTERILDIEEDKAPVADFTGAETIYRNPQSSNQATYELFNKSYSVDNDYIGKMQVYTRHDSDNDGVFTNHAWTLAYDGANKDKLPLTFSSIGKYQIRLVATESFGQPTIGEFIIEADYKSGQVIKDFEVQNLQPSIQFSQKTKKKIDLAFQVDSSNSKYSKSFLTSGIESVLKPLLMANNIEANITVEDIQGVWDKYNTKDGYNFSGYREENYNNYASIWLGEYRSGSSFSWENNYYATFYQNYGFSEEVGFYGIDPIILNTKQASGYYFISEGGQRTEVFKLGSYSHRGMWSWNNYIVWDIYEEQFHYLADGKLTKIKNQLIEDDLVQPEGTYPEEGVFSDNYWYSKEKNYFSIIKGNINKKMDELSSSPNKKAYIFVSDSSFVDDDISKKDKLINTFGSNNLYFYGLGTASNLADINKIVALNDNKGCYIDNNNISTCLSTLANNIIASLDNTSKINGDYLLVNEEFETNTFYEDYENDPMYQTKFNYVHDPSVFENNQGADPDSGKTLSSPPSSFSRVGRYDITAQVQDKPSTDTRFLSYYKWSEPAQKTVYVHRKPFAEPKMTYAYDGNLYVLSLTDSSYDLDHISLGNKGIVQKVWSYKDASDSEAEWIEGKPTSFPVNSKYYVKLSVMDMEFAWGSKILIFNPGAKGSISIDPMAREWANTGLTVNINYSEPEILSKLKYQVTNSAAAPAGGWTETTAASAVKSINQEGIYYVHAHAIDNSGLVVGAVGGPYKVDLTPPVISINKAAGTYTPQIDLTISATDTLSGVKSIRYAWSTSTTAPVTGWVTVNSAMVNVTQANEGVYYLYTESYDNVNNKSAVTRYGPFTIIRNRPPVLTFTGTSPSFLYEGDNVAINFTVTDQTWMPLTAML